MKILMCFPLFRNLHWTKDPGQIALHLARRGHEVSVIAYPPPEGQAIDQKVPFVFASRSFWDWPSKDPVSWSYMLAVGKIASKLDVLFHYHVTKIGISTSLLFKCLTLGKGTVIFKLDNNAEFQSPSTLWWARAKFTLSLYGRMRLLSWLADRVIIESPDAQTRLCSRFPFLKSLTVMLPNGINTADFKPSEGSRTSTILFAARLEAQKGIDILIKAFDHLANRFENWSLEIAGSTVPAFQEELQSQLAKTGHSSRIKFHGVLGSRELAEALRRSAIFCLPSRKRAISYGEIELANEKTPGFGTDHFPIGLLEAMASGCAIVASEVGSIPYMLEYGKAGVLASADDANALGQALEKLMEDSALRESIGSRARSRCQQLFEWSLIAQQLDVEISQAHRVAMS